MLMPYLSKEDYINKVRFMTDHVKKQITKPSGLSDAHLDHIVPIIFGYENGILPEVMSLPENLIYVASSDNLKKNQSLTHESTNILMNWIEQKKIDKKFKFFIDQETHYKQAMLKYDFSEMYKQLENNVMTTIENLPSDIAYSFIPVFCQRRFDLRWEKTRKALGHIALPTHRMMICAVYPDGQIVRLDANTRTYIFENDLQFSDYEKPTTWHVTFINVKNDREAEQIYHSIDSSETAETFAEKISGYLNSKKYNVNLPNVFQKGERVYDIAVVAIDNYIPPNEREPVQILKTSDLAVRASETVKCLDYFIEEFVILGQMLGSENIPRGLSSPLMGMLIRYLMTNKSKNCESIVRTVVRLSKTKLSVFSRPYMISGKDSIIERNILIMLDEMKTPEETEFTINYHVPYRTTTTRAILPTYATKTTANTGDRRLYCGWIAYCMDKCIAGEKIDEDILFDVTGEKVTNDTKTSVHHNLKSTAASDLMNRYDAFWKTH